MIVPHTADGKGQAQVARMLGCSVSTVKRVRARRRDFGEAGLVDRQTRAWLAEHGRKFRLHSLPPYCPDDNRIERRVWREVHANVTRNHDCGSIEQLRGEVTYHLMSRNRAAKRRWLRGA